MNKRKRKKSFWKTSIHIIALCFTLFIGLELFISYIEKYKNINLKDLNTKLYIQATDNTSSEIFQATQYLEQAKAIEKAVYSTVENEKGEEIYSKLLIDIIQEQNLQLLDYECEMNCFKGNQR